MAGAGGGATPATGAATGAQGAKATAEGATDGASDADGEQLMNERVLRNVFDYLDTDHNGVLEARDVREGLRMMGLPSSQGSLRSFLRKLDKDADSRVSYAEFASYALLHDEALHKLWRTFHSEGGQGTTPRELRHALRRMDVHLSKPQAARLHEQIAADEQAQFTQFCSLLMLLPTENAAQTLMTWLDESGFDTGDEIHLPAGQDGPAASWQLLLSGMVAGVVSRTSTAPMDRMKVMLQASPKPSHSSVSGVFKHILREGGGAFAFWRGNGVNCLKIGPETGLRFWAYENAKAVLCQDPDDVTVPERFVAGALAGSFAQLGVYPLEIAKTRLALAKTGEYRGLMDCLAKLARSGGIPAMYRGLSASITGIVPYSGVDLTVYSLLRDLYAEKHPGESFGVVVPLTCGAISTTCGQLVAYPLQLVRTRLQAQGMPDRPVVYSGMVDCFTKILRSEGVSGLYKGIIPNFMKSLPAISISYAVYETVKARLVGE